MIVSPTVEQYRNALSLNGCHAELIQKISTIYTDNELKSKVLTPDGLLWDYNNFTHVWHKHIINCGLWEKMCNGIKEKE